MNAARPEAAAQSVAMKPPADGGPGERMPSRSVVICECAARDGLQHEAAFVPTSTKVALIDLFTALGFPRIEATSFSHPKHVPQFADAEEVLRRIARGSGVAYKATCVNGRAVERAVRAVEQGFGPTEISVVISASETHQLRNTRTRHAQMRRQFEEMIDAARAAGLRVVGTVATAFGCPFTGPVPFSAVDEWVSFFAGLGANAIALGDTTGMANPASVRQTFAALMPRHPGAVWIGHFHDTRGLGLANALAALEAGVTHLDSAFGGLGGHPARIEYGQGHTGNVATEDLVAALEDMGWSTGIATDRLVEAARRVEEALGRQLHGRVARAGLATQLLG